MEKINHRGTYRRLKTKKNARNKAVAITVDIEKTDEGWYSWLLDLKETLLKKGRDVFIREYIKNRTINKKERIVKYYVLFEQHHSYKKNYIDVFKLYPLKRNRFLGYRLKNGVLSKQVFKSKNKKKGNEDVLHNLESKGNPSGMLNP